MDFRSRGRRWFVYLLRCADGTLYCGVTNALKARVAAHNAGKGAKYTRTRLPVELIWSMSAKDRGAALRREYALKQRTRAEKLAMVAAWQERSARCKSQNRANKKGTERFQ